MYDAERKVGDESQCQRANMHTILQKERKKAELL